jgi:hypothetical protein
MNQEERMEGAKKELTRVHRAGNPVSNIQRCKDCGVILASSRPHFYDDTDLILVDDRPVVHDHGKNPYAVRCNQDFVPPDLEDEVHVPDLTGQDQMDQLRTMFSSLIEKLEKDKAKDLTGIYRYEVKIEVAKFKQDPNNPTGWHRIW